ncbi:hypothetical protein X777_06803 [Ooceraea biroi]|uniref:Uncharacterized protein n=1 Tax=Ooceraea biroi TaxID=2015173 RepID=A0A026WDF9_OOCBI|nr:hypothetical protein X777_06803 [Ooceraea biroi]
MKIFFFLLGAIMVTVLTLPETKATAMPDALAAPIGEADADALAAPIGEADADASINIDKLIKRYCKTYCKLNSIRASIRKRLRQKPARGLYVPNMYKCRC